MKFELKNNQVVAIAENVNESSTLLALQEKPKAEVETPAKRTYKKRKKRMVAKVCPVCDRACKGNTGLAVHLRTAHQMDKQEAREAVSGWDKIPVVKAIPVTQ